MKPVKGTPKPKPVVANKPKSKPSPKKDPYPEVPPDKLDRSIYNRISKV